MKDESNKSEENRKVTPISENVLNRLKLRINNGEKEVYDSLRRKWIKVTPEEIVRQLFVDWLIENKGYPPSLMGNEIGLHLNGMIRRCDTIIYDKNLSPIAIVEYKAPHITISKKTFNQIARYNSVIKARVLIVSNGVDHYCCRYTGECYEFLREIPDYQDI